MPTITQPYQTLLHTCEDGVATITLNRPAQRNALDMVMREEQPMPWTRSGATARCGS